MGIGNFEEVGPLDNLLKPRNSTWLRKADLLFVVCYIYILWCHFNNDNDDDDDDDLVWSIG